MTSVPDASKKLIAQVATDAGLKHEPMRKREAARRTASRKPRPALPPQPDQQMEDVK
jgi:hypothetical protein